MNDLHNDSMQWAHPIVREWFISQYKEPTAPQIAGWPAILSRQSTLISAPTGSGKTFAAFLVCIDTLVRAALQQQLSAQTTVVYVSPLKALTNDIQKNLLKPLAEIKALALARQLNFTDIEVAVRTGDTLHRERQAMLKRPPHIIVTTPESLYLLLTAEKSRNLLRNVHTIIVDEIHALANNKRGTHLSLSLERLEALTPTPPLRIGLSATQKPIEKVAAFLAGNQRALPTIINIGHARQLNLYIEVPRTPLAAVTANTVWDEIYDRIAALAQEHRSILVFVNTRKLSERLAHHLGERIGSELVAAHHGSLSRKLRLEAEHGLKTGQLKIIVATASLELGIDIGTVDRVCQIGSPRAIAIGLQRVGRAGHWHGAVSHGHFFATTRDELAECAALVNAIYSGELDELIIPEQPLDILAQQLVACCAAEDWSIDALYQLITKSYPYRQLSRAEFDGIIHILSDGIAAARGRYGTYLFLDQVNGQVKARRGSRMAAILNGGAIPETNLFTVYALPDEMMVGTLDEDFAIESHRGDIILLGNTSWRVQKVESTKGRVYVEDAHGAPPTVPFWIGEAPGRSDELSRYVSSLRTTIRNHFLAKTERELHEWLRNNCRLPDYGVQQLLDYFREGQAVLGAIPTQEKIIAERFFDEAGGMQLILHSPFGARINKAWGLALRKRFCRSFNFELQAAATDDGIAISLAEQHSFPLADVFQFLHPQSIHKVLLQAVLQSPLFITRWRWVAVRSLALLRFRNGRKVPPHLLRMYADDLLAAVFPEAAACQDNLAGQEITVPDHPLITETLKDCLYEALDYPGLAQLITAIQQQAIECIAVDTPMPSAFCQEILNANPYAFLDDAPLEERRARAVSMRRILPESFSDNLAQLDQNVISEVKGQSWPDIRNADELHDFLQTLILLPEDLSDGGWQPFFQELLTGHRAGHVLVNGKTYWLATEKKSFAVSIFPQAIYPQDLPSLSAKEIDSESALQALLRGWLQHLGPITVSELHDYLGIPAPTLMRVLTHLEMTGLILRGHFRSNITELEWCERRLLARIHMFTLARLRQEIAPVSTVQFVGWLGRWQHLGVDNQLKGEHGLLEIIKQLQGFEIAANAWEKQIFAKRIQDYSPDLLDRLCLAGVITWGRLSLHPTLAASLGDKEENKSTIQPNSVSPITFFLREDASWLAGKTSLHIASLDALSYIAQQIYHYLAEEGASFFEDIVHDLNRLKTEVEMALWELVAAGLITADSFDNLRALIDPKRRNGRRGYRSLRQISGRWSLLKNNKPLDRNSRTEKIAWILLKRYGVCFRELAMREHLGCTWFELLTVFRRLEAQGEIRGGRFVQGFSGEQYALSYAVESLRQWQRENHPPQEFTINAVDPLNFTGILFTGERIPARASKSIRFGRDGFLAQDG